MDFDLFTILPLAAAVFVFWKLRQTLGTRNGAEPPVEPMDDFRRGGAPNADNADRASDNVVTLPRREDAEVDARRAAELEAAIVKMADGDEGLEAGLRAIAKRDADFDPVEFVGGARAAYEMIVTAFADGDKDTLKTLLSADVYDSFAAVIDARAESGETVNSTFVGIDDAKITGAAMERDEAHVTVSFVSEIIQATTNRAGDVIDGDLAEVAEIRDRWTFARSVTARDPNWKLVATDDDA